MKSIRQIIKEEIDDFDWVRNQLDQTPDDPEVYVLSEIYGIEVIRGIEEKDYTHYDLKVYGNEDGEEYAIGTEDEFDKALHDYWEGLIDDVGPDGIGMNLEYYLDVPEWWVNSFCSEEADSLTEDFDDEEIIDRANDIDDDYQTDYDELLVVKEELEVLFEETEDKQLEYDDDSPEWGLLENELDNIRTQQKQNEWDIENLIDKAREEVREDYENGCLECMESPVDCLVKERGYFSNVNEMLRYNSNITIDTDEMVKDMVRDSNYGEISSYDGNYESYTLDDVTYYTIRIN